MRLFHSSSSPFARKVMVVAHETNLVARLELSAIPAPTLPTHDYPELARQNPLSKIPALVLDDGSVLYDSRVICEYLDSLHDGARMLPPGRERFPILRLQALADGAIDAGIVMRFEQAFRPEALRWSAWTDGQAKKVIGALDAMEVETFGSTLDLGQIAVVCALEWLEFRKPLPDIREARPRLFAWFDTIRQRPSFVATAPR